MVAHSYLPPDFFCRFSTIRGVAHSNLFPSSLSQHNQPFTFFLRHFHQLTSHGVLTGTRGDVALLVLLWWTQAGLTSVLGLWIGAGALAAADPPAAVPAALRPGAPRRPAAVQRVAGHPSKTKNLPCYAVDNVGLGYDTACVSFVFNLMNSDIVVFIPEGIKTTY